MTWKVASARVQGRRRHEYGNTVVGSDPNQDRENLSGKLLVQQLKKDVAATTATLSWGRYRCCPLAGGVTSDASRAKFKESDESPRELQMGSPPRSAARGPKHAFLNTFGAFWRPPGGTRQRGLLAAFWRPAGGRPRVLQGARVQGAARGQASEKCSQDA